MIHSLLKGLRKGASGSYHIENNSWIYLKYKIRADKVIFGAFECSIPCYAVFVNKVLWGHFRPIFKQPIYIRAK